MVTIQNAGHEGGYRIKIQFSTGETGVLDLAPIIARYPAAASLRDPTEFAKFYLDDWPTLVWPCGFDLSPETLYELATGKPPAWLETTEAAA